MRKTIVLIILIALFCIAFAGTKPEFKLYSQTPRYGDPVSLPKDSMAIASGAVSILPLGGDMRGFAPPYATSVEYDSNNDLLQVISSQVNAGSFVGVYNTYSTDNGYTWAAPSLISDAGTWIRNYNALATAPADNYPYVVVQNPGICFTTDALGPGGGGWTGTVQVIDTTSNTATAPNIAVNNDGSKVIIATYDSSNGIGINTSSDYGSTWGTYHIHPEFKGNDPGTELMQISSVKPIWCNGDTVFILISATFNEDSIRSDIAGSGPGTAIGFGYSISTDAGATFSPVTKLFDGHSIPEIPSLNGDTIVFYMDTIPNGSPDSIEFHAYLDPATGLWTDDYDGSIGGGNGFGSWWYWWDAEIIGNRVYTALPFADLFIDYYIDGDLYTFPWQGQSIMFGYMDIAAGDSVFTWEYHDVHDGNILDTLGNTYTWLGNLYSANITGDNNLDCYIIYNDYWDTSTGVTSVMCDYYDASEDTLQHWMWGSRMNVGSYITECPSKIIRNGSNYRIPFAFVSYTQDSIYFSDIAWGIDEQPSQIDPISISDFANKNNLISFIMYTYGETEISVYDVTGRFEDNIFTGTLDKGEHTFILNKNITSGVHFVKINMNGQDYYGKVCIIK